MTAAWSCGRESRAARGAHERERRDDFIVVLVMLVFGWNVNERCDGARPSGHVPAADKKGELRIARACGRRKVRMPGMNGGNEP